MKYFKKGDGVMCENIKQKRDLLQFVKNYGYRIYEFSLTSISSCINVVYDGEKFIGADKGSIKNPISIEEFKNLIIQDNKKTMTYKAKRKDLEKIVKLPVCKDWVHRITYWCKETPFGDTIELSEKKVSEMFKAAPTATRSMQLIKILNEMFPDFEKAQYSFKMGDEFTFKSNFTPTVYKVMLCKISHKTSALIITQPKNKAGNIWGGKVQKTPFNLTIDDFQTLCGILDFNYYARDIYKTKH